MEPSDSELLIRLLPTFRGFSFGFVFISIMPSISLFMPLFMGDRGLIGRYAPPYSTGGDRYRKGKLFA